MLAIFKAIPDLFFRLDGSGTILDCKADAKTDFIVDPKKMIGKRIQDIPERSISDRFQAAVDRLRSEKNIIVMEYSLAPRGQKQFYEARLVPFLEDQIVAIIRNTTWRKRAEEALEKRILALTRPQTTPPGSHLKTCSTSTTFSAFRTNFPRQPASPPSSRAPMERPSLAEQFLPPVHRHYPQNRKGRANCYKSDSIIDELPPRGRPSSLCLSGGLWDAGIEAFWKTREPRC